MDNLTKKLYKKYMLCRICGERYGSDIGKDDGLCPIHSRINYKDGGSMLKRMKQRKNNGKQIVRRRSFGTQRLS